MIQNQKVIVVMPAYNAAKTLEKTFHEVMAQEVVDHVLLVDDYSHDETVKIAEQLGIEVLVHPQNRGYGANQKTCYNAALKLGYDIIIMVHPDYQYTPRLIPPMAHLIASGLYPVILGSRILGGGALKGGMPVYKYVSNRLLTFSENLLLGSKISDFHTGYRGFARFVLEAIPYEQNSNDFIFDNQLLCQVLFRGWPIAEITCPANYFPEASSINFQRSFKYGCGCLTSGLKFRLNKWNILNTQWLRK
jgi:glycosyltransferase involved in cell wall biosynthesis